jgi:competence protein ComEC
MAALAATAAMLGREASGLRLLSLAVTVLLVIDPFLVDSAGFQLSVAASAAILLLSHRLAARLPGPRPLAEAVAVSAAAQVGVAPILVVTFGGAPVSGLLANVLAAPAAGPVMVWGVGAGLAGGLLGPGLASVLHLPTRALIWWIALVAERGARWPLGQLRGGEVVAVLVGAVCIAAFQRAGKASGAALVIAGLLAPAAAQAGTPPALVELGGASLWRAGGGVVLVVGASARADAVLGALREAGVDQLDLVVLTGPGRDAIADVVATRMVVRAVVRPGDVDVPAVVQCGGLEVLLEPTAGRLTAIVRAISDRSRSPPLRRRVLEGRVAAAANSTQ